MSALDLYRQKEMQKVKAKIYTSTPMMQDSGTLPKRTSQCRQKKEKKCSERNEETKT